MSHEKLGDWLEDNCTDLLDNYIQTDKGWKDMEKFIFSKEGEPVLEFLMEKFLNNSKARIDFEQWASELYQNRGPDPEEFDVDENR